MEYAGSHINSTALFLHVPLNCTASQKHQKARKSSSENFKVLRGKKEKARTTMDSSSCFAAN